MFNGNLDRQIRLHEGSLPANCCMSESQVTPIAMISAITSNLCQKKTDVSQEHRERELTGTGWAHRRVLARTILSQQQLNDFSIQKLFQPGQLHIRLLNITDNSLLYHYHHSSGVVLRRVKSPVAEEARVSRVVNARVANVSCEPHEEVSPRAGDRRWRLAPAVALSIHPSSNQSVTNKGPQLTSNCTLRV